MFLSTWRGPTIPGHTAPHPSIHHFCTEIHGPQLPPQLTVVSKLTHSNKQPKHTHSYLSKVDFDAEKLCERKMESQKEHLSEERLDNIEKRWGLVKQEESSSNDEEVSAAIVIPQIQLESSSSTKSQRSASPGRKISKSRGNSALASQATSHDSSANLIDSGTDRLVSTARARLRKHMKESERSVSPSQALGVVGARDIQVESLLRTVRPRSAKSGNNKQGKKRGEVESQEGTKGQKEKQGRREMKMSTTGGAHGGEKQKKVTMQDNASLPCDKTFQVASSPLSVISSFAEKVTR